MREPSLWRGGAPLLLASTSGTRRMLLESAGLPVETEAPDIDERAIEAGMPKDPRGIAQQLARQKVLAVSRRRPDRIVIGADQTLACESRLFHKPADRESAREQLAALAGRVHALHSAFAIAKGGAIIHEDIANARLAMRPLSADNIDLYLDQAGDTAQQSVGVYQVEGLGIHLFESIEGDYSTILGLPLLPLLAALRKRELLAF
jgi:septum formation protein